VASPVRIRCWYTRRPKLSPPYLAPELVGLAVAGEVHGHPRKPDGTRVTTSRVVRVMGRRFWTESGTEYEFDGAPQQTFLDFLKAAGREYDEAEPIKIVGGRRG
jgi:hypothetical protein